MYSTIIFTVLSLPLIWVSRHCFDIRHHGLYRWLAWEAMLWLLIVNLPFWFVDPLDLPQIMAWVLLFGSLGLVIPGITALQKINRQKPPRQDENLYQFERTGGLVTTGIYRYIRHPMYGSLLLLNWGIYFKHLTWGRLVLAGFASLMLYLTARMEEKEDIAVFGDQYRDYIKRSKRFIPFIF